MSNYKKLEIVYGLITTNSTGNQWAPVVSTLIYPNCNNYNLYARFAAGVSNADYADVQLDINRNAKNLYVYVYKQSTNKVVGFFIMYVYGIRF